VPVSVTMGVAQNGHSAAWMVLSYSVRAPQLSQVMTRVVSTSSAGICPAMALR